MHGATNPVKYLVVDALGKLVEIVKPLSIPRLKIVDERLGIVCSNAGRRDRGDMTKQMEAIDSSDESLSFCGAERMVFEADYLLCRSV